MHQSPSNKTKNVFLFKNVINLVQAIKKTPTIAMLPTKKDQEQQNNPMGLEDYHHRLGLLVR